MNISGLNMMFIQRAK